MSNFLLVGIFAFILLPRFRMTNSIAQNDMDHRIQVNKQKGGLESEDMKEFLQLAKLRIYARNVSFDFFFYGTSTLIYLIPFFSIHQL